MKELLTNFRKDFKLAMKELEKKYGFDIELGNITYAHDEKSFTGKIEAVKVEEGKTREQADFEKNAHLYGFKPEDYKKEYIVKGVTYQLIGFNRKARKNPFLIRDIATNSEYTCPLGFLNNAENSDITDEERETKEKEDFSFYSFKFGFKPEDYKKEYNINGTVYQHIGFKPRATKNSIIIKDKSTGKTYSCSKEALGY